MKNTTREVVVGFEVVSNLPTEAQNWFEIDFRKRNNRGQERSYRGKTSGFQETWNLLSKKGSEGVDNLRTETTAVISFDRRESGQVFVRLLRRNIGDELKVTERELAVNGQRSLVGVKIGKR